jgi:hypothetical protein
MSRMALHIVSLILSLLQIQRNKKKVKVLLRLVGKLIRKTKKILRYGKAVNQVNLNGRANGVKEDLYFIYY